MQIWAESGKSALPICNYSQILYQFLTFTQNLKRSLQFPIHSIYTLLFYLTKLYFYLPYYFPRFYFKIFTYSKCIISLLNNMIYRRTISNCSFKITIR